MLPRRQPLDRIAVAASKAHLRQINRKKDVVPAIELKPAARKSQHWDNRLVGAVVVSRPPATKLKYDAPILVVQHRRIRGSSIGNARTHRKGSNQIAVGEIITTPSFYSDHTFARSRYRRMVRSIGGRGLQRAIVRA